MMRQAPVLGIPELLAGDETQSDSRGPAVAQPEQGTDTLNTDMTAFLRRRIAELEAALALEKAQSRVEQALRESEMRYRSLADLSPDVILVNADGRYVYANPAAARLLGAKDPQQILGRSPLELLDSEYHDTVRERIRLVMEERNSTPLMEFRWRRIDGSGSVDVEVAAGPIEWQEKPAVQVVARDVTERKRAEVEREGLLAEVRQRAAELEAVIESTQAQLALLDRDMNFLMVNSAYERGSGHSRHELIGSNHFDLFPHAENQAIFQRVRDSGIPYQVIEKPFEFVGQPERATTYWNWVLVPIPDEQGQTRELLLSLLDVTEQVKTRQSVEAAVKARDEFMSIASHELKTPVTSLQGYAQLMIRELGKRGTVDPLRLARSMERIEEQSKRLARLTDQLLNLSRLEAGKLKLAPEEADVVALVENVVATIRHAQAHRVLELRTSQPVIAHIDPIRLEQVVTNLLDNALKFSPVETPVDIEVGADRSGRVRIAVRDRGIGVPEHEREEIFGRFYQAHAERHYGGMGIGLFISHQIVEMHGGTITLEQPEDGGSRFIVHLPACSHGIIST